MVICEAPWRESEPIATGRLAGGAVTAVQVELKSIRFRGHLVLWKVEVLPANPHAS
jgi:hypothetical protein